MEELCLRAFKLSLDLTIVPIKKLLFVYYIYLRTLFDGPPKHTVPPVRIINKDLYQREFKAKEKEKSASKSPVEEFYVSPKIRNTNRDAT